MNAKAKAQLYQKEFLKRFANSLALKRQKKAFQQWFKTARWSLLNGNSVQANLSYACRKKCGLLIHRPKLDARCLKQIAASIQRSKREGKSETFRCPAKLWGFCAPIRQGDSLYGVILVSNLKAPPEEKLLRLFTDYTQTVVEEVQRELELSKLYESIRPRAIALSTIHTVRRLISSVLEIEELLPRLARLCMQILRAKQCSILLIDQAKNLTPKVCIQSEKISRSKRAAVCLNIALEKRVAKNAKALLKKKFLAAPLIDEDVIGVISVRNKINNRGFDPFDEEILSTLCEQAVVAIKNAQLYAEQQKITLGSIKSLSTILDTKFSSGYRHSPAFADIVLSLGKELALNQEELKSLNYAAILHDAGKIGIPEEILKKPAKLTGKEYRLIKAHPSKGAEIIKHLDILKPALPIILHHHERYNGSGYPSGLKRQQIPLGARIMAVVDAFEAMIGTRPYRKTSSIKHALKEIKKNCGSQFDPQVVRAFEKLAMNGQIQKILKEKGRAS
jgi:HD-GYP domain-containing protein (c-di-GMP phosphodiesterase class II)/ligand-binding sensor protein